MSRRAMVLWPFFALLCAAGCSDKPDKAAPRAGAAAAKAAQSPAPGARIVVGATLPLTGADASGGRAVREGYELAFEQVNAAGGLFVGGWRVPVALELRDDESKPDKAVAEAEALVSGSKVDFLLGTYGSTLVAAQAPVAERLGVPYLNTTGAAKEIYAKPHRWLFGVQSTIDLLAYNIMRWIDDQQAKGRLPRPARIAIVVEKTAHGREFREGVLDFATRSQRRRGTYNVVADESFALNERDFKPLLGRVRDAKADLFLADAHLADFIQMHRQYSAMGLCHPVVSYGARGSEKEAAVALGNEAVSYLVSAVWWSPQLAEKGGPSERFLEAFERKYGREPQWYQAVAWDGARALFAAVERAGTADREAVRQKLASMSNESVLPGGTLRFDMDQHGRAPYVVQQTQPDGSAPIVYPNDLATAPGLAPNPRCKPASAAAER